MAAPRMQEVASRPNATPRQQCIKRWSALKEVRQSWLSHWEEISLYEQPRRGRYLVSDTNHGGKKNDKVLNGEAIDAGRTLEAGMVSGITSPARKWFRLAIPDPVLDEAPDVRSWLTAVEDGMFEVIARSNFYDQVAQAFGDLLFFGTASMFVEEDLEDVIRCQTFPIGSYVLANNSRMRVNTLGREFQFTASQVLERWPDTCSQRVRQLVEKGQTETPVRILLLVEPRKQRDAGRAGWRHMPYRSVWLELDHPDDASAGYLHEGGFEEFPAMCPRWNLQSEDVYGRSPGMDALGDVKQLMYYEREGAKAMAKVVSPPMIADPGLQLQGVDLLPGSVNYGDMQRGGALKPAQEPDVKAVEVAEAKIASLQRRIRRFFLADLWELFTAEERRQVTAEEIRARQQEKLLLLGPVLERLSDELLDPFIDRLFGIMLRTGLIPPPPEELAGMQLRVEYISIMAQAQKMVGIGAVERLLGFVLQAATLPPHPVVDNLNVDRMVTDFARMVGVNPEMVHADEEREAIRQARAEAAKAAQMAEQMANMAKGAKDLAGADMEGDNGLTRLVDGMSPVAAAGVAQ